MSRVIVIGVVMVTLLATAWTVLAQLTGGPAPRFSLSGGGGVSNSDRFILSGVISRPDGGRRLSGETFTLQGGFQVSAANPRPRVCGDQNNDGKVNIFDAIIELQIIVKLIDPTERQEVQGDVVRDGRIDVFDVIYTLQHIVGIISSISGCGLPAPQSQVEEVPNPVVTGADPILQGGRVDPEEVLGALPPPPPEFQDKGAHDLFEETEWTFVQEVELGPGQSLTENVSITEASLLQARATWFGALVPIEMAVSLDGTPLATGKVFPAPPNRGTITADVQIDSTGGAAVSVINNGQVPVAVQILIGVLPLSSVQ